jgi:DNA-binding transcriptional LysR family regulator
MTRAGAVFKGHLDRALHELDDGLAALADTVSPDGGEVSLAFQPSLGTGLVPALIAGFRELHPSVQFDLHALHGELTAADFLPGGAELAITTLRHSIANVAWRPLKLEPLSLIVWAGHRLATRESVALAELADEQFIMLRPSHGLRQATVALCHQAGFEPLVAMECDDLATLTGLVAGRLGVAIAPATTTPAPVPEAAVIVLAISDPGAARLLGLAWSTERRLLPVAQRFRDHVLATATAAGTPAG